MKFVVHKYGGSSLSTIVKIQAVAKKVSGVWESGFYPIVVVSAQGGETNSLLALAHEISPRPTPRELDALLAVGEQKSSALLAMALNDLGLEAVSLTGGQAGISTEGSFGDSRILDIEIEKIRQHADAGRIVVIAGFQGINGQGAIATLGRGGTDITAVAMAAALGCPCEIYTDVAGIYNVDPALIPGAKKFKIVSWDALSEMASLGARVLNERAIELGRKFSVPIYIASSHSEEQGTQVLEVEELEEDKVTAVLVDDDILRISIKNVPADANSQQQLFELLSQRNINLGMVQREGMENGNIHFSFTCAGNCRRVIEDLERLLPYPVEIIWDESRISLFGIGMLNQAKVTSCIFQNLASLNIGLRHLVTSERSLSLFIDKGDRDRVVNQLARAFQLSEGRA